MPHEKIQMVVVPTDPGATYDLIQTLSVRWEHRAGDRDGGVHVEIDLQDSAILAHGLSRAEVNRLIHALRRARDAAYGKDA